MNSQPAGPRQQTALPSFAEAFRFWLKLGFISFGGPTGQIAIMQNELVEKKKWISQSRFLKALKNEIMWALAALAFVAIFFFHAPFPMIILGAGLIGLIGGRFWKEKFDVVSGHDGVVDESVLSDAAEAPEHARPSLTRAIKLIAVWVVLWFAPIVAIGLWKGWGSTLFNEGLFFSKAAVVTFGGAYALLSYVAQQALFHYGWLRPGQMMDGLGLAETTPGPLMMVVPFVGFLGAWQHPDGLPPLLAATLGA